MFVAGHLAGAAAEWGKARIGEQRRVEVGVARAWLGRPSCGCGRVGRRGSWPGGYGAMGGECSQLGERRDCSSELSSGARAPWQAPSGAGE